MGHWVQIRVVRTTVWLKHLWTSWIEVTPNNCNFLCQLACRHHWTLFIISAGEWRPWDHLHPSVLYLTPIKIFWQLAIWLVQILPCTFKLPTRETYRFCWPSHQAFISIFQLRVSPDPSVISTHILLHTSVSSRGGYLMVLVVSRPFPLSVPSGHI